MTNFFNIIIAFVVRLQADNNTLRPRLRVKKDKKKS